jgi:hypothetical protein
MKSYMLLVFILYVVLVFPKIVSIVVCFHPFTLENILLYNPHKDKGLYISKEKARNGGTSI